MRYVLCNIHGNLGPFAIYRVVGLRRTFTLYRKTWVFKMFYNNGAGIFSPILFWERVNISTFSCVRCVFVSSILTGDIKKMHQLPILILIIYSDLRQPQAVLPAL